VDVSRYINGFDGKSQFVVVNDVVTMNISSTEVRNKIKNGSNLNKLLDFEVINYIKENDLYKEV
jgi:nicotinic acid mononucleotide adenylyltransferase